MADHRTFAKLSSDFRASPQKLSAFFIIVICIGGLLYQVIDVSTLYFSYYTRSEIKISIPFSINPPYISLCFQYRDVMDYNRVSKDPRFTNHTFQRPLDPTSDESIYFESYFTVADIFSLTPNIYQFFGKSGKFLTPNGSVASYSCLYREPGSFIANHYTERECRSLFRFEKYIQRHFICYLIYIPRDFNKKYDITHASLSKEWFGLIFRLILNPDTFKHVNYFTVFAHEKNSDKLFDSTLTNSMTKAFSNYNLTTGDDVQVSYYSSTIIKLRAPYDTNCFNLSAKYKTRYSSGTGVQLHCLNKYLKKNISHIAPIGQTFYAYPNMSLARLSSDYDAKIFDRALNLCNITAATCYLRSMSTKTKILPSKYFAVSLFWPQDTINEVIYRPRMESVEYLLFMASCIGFWFGFSALSFLFQTKTLLSSLIPDLPYTIETNFCGNELQARPRNVRRVDCRDEVLKRKDLDEAVANILFKIQFDLSRQLNERNKDIIQIILDMLERKERKQTRYHLSHAPPPSNKQ